MYPMDFHPDDQHPWPDRKPWGMPFQPRIAHKDYPDLKTGKLIHDPREGYIRLPAGNILFLGGSGTNPRNFTKQQWANPHQYFIDVTIKKRSELVAVLDERAEVVRRKMQREFDIIRLAQHPTSPTGEASASKKRKLSERSATPLVASGSIAQHRLIISRPSPEQIAAAGLPELRNAAGKIGPKPTLLYQFAEPGAQHNDNKRWYYAPPKHGEQAHVRALASWLGLKFGSRKSRNTGPTTRAVEDYINEEAQGYSAIGLRYGSVLPGPRVYTDQDDNADGSVNGSVTDDDDDEEDFVGDESEDEAQEEEEDEEMELQAGGFDLAERLTLSPDRSVKDGIL